MDGVLNLAGQQGFDEPQQVKGGVIHISIQQRNARKSITKVQGIDPAVDLEKVLKALKKVCLVPPISKVCFNFVTHAPGPQLQRCCCCRRR